MPYYPHSKRLKGCGSGCGGCLLLLFGPGLVVALIPIWRVLFWIGILALLVGGGIWIYGWWEVNYKKWP